MSDDPYWDDKNDVLRNKLGITDTDKLAKAEAALTVQRIDQIIKNPIVGDYDESHFNEFHKQIFEPVYDWAGESRSATGWSGDKPEDVLNMQSVEYPTVYGENGAPTLEDELSLAFENLSSDNNLKNLNPDEFVEKVTEHMTALWKAHSFREGNTRATTEFIRQLAKDAGHPLAPEFPEQKSLFRDALVLSSAGFKTELTEQFRAGVMPIEVSEHAINHREQQLVDELLSNKHIDFELNTNNTASNEYIEKAIDLLDDARSAVSEDLRDDLHAEHVRLDLQDKLDAESVLFEKFVSINSELFEIELAFTAHKMGENVDISGLAERRDELNKDLYLDKELDNGLTFERKEEGLMRANTFLNALKFKDVPLLSNSGEKAYFSSKKMRIDIPADRAKRFLDQSRSLVTKFVNKDIEKKVSMMDSAKSATKLKESAFVENEKRQMVIRKAINNKYPEHTKRVRDRLNHETANAHLKEIKSLSRANDIATSRGGVASSKIQSNDYRVSYLTNKLEKTPELSKYLTKSDSKAISSARDKIRERASREKSVELER